MLLIGTLLVGIVFFNVDVLRLNRSIASVSERATALKQENARLLLEEARLASSDRIQQAAAAAGMVLPAPGDVHYLKVRRGDAGRASQLMTAPQPVPPPAATPRRTEPAVRAGNEPRIQVGAIRYSQAPPERTVTLAIDGGTPLTLHQGESTGDLEVQLILPDGVYVRRGGHVWMVSADR